MGRVDERLPDVLWRMPLTIAEQAEGSVIFGLSAALYSKITVKDGRSGAGKFRYLPHGAFGGGAEDRCPSRPKRRQGLGWHSLQFAVNIWQRFQMPAHGRKGRRIPPRRPTYGNPAAAGVTTWIQRG
jgi:hypothetical protein